VQATLLSIGIAVILTLLAALVGPHFIDWAQYRSTFEAEASRLTGMPVRVHGPIDARLLPTPSLVLRDVEVGVGTPSPQLHARELSVEFALGPLLRGHWRASELRLLDPAMHIGIARDGTVDWPRTPAELDPDQLAIDRFVLEGGTLALSDAGSNRQLMLDRLTLAGEFRSLLGPAKGEGRFEANGESYQYSVSASRLEDEAVKLRIEIAPANRPWTAEADGILGFAGAAPEFDGTLKVARPAGMFDAAGRRVESVPWRAAGHVKASAANALFDKAEFQYGPEERAIRLSGVANIKFGRAPRYEAVISGRQLDLDPFLALPESARRLPFAAAQQFAELFTGPLKLPIPGHVGIGIESVMLAGSPLREVRGDLSSDGDRWDIEHLEFRAPGFTSARVSGRLGFADHRATFRGPATIEANDPRALLAWLEGSPAAAHGASGSLRASGELTLGPNRVAIDRLKAELDRKEISGRLAYAFPLYRQPARLDLALKAAELDLDELAATAPAILAGTKPEFPGELRLSAEIDRAIIAGVVTRNAGLDLSYDGAGLVVDRLSIGDFGGAALNLSGRMRGPFGAPQGTMALELKAGALEGLLAIGAKLSPQLGESIRASIARLSPLDLRANLTIGAPEKAGERQISKVVVNGMVGTARLQLASEVKGNPLDPRTLELEFEGNVAAADGAQLAGLLGLRRWINLEKGRGSAHLAFHGRPSDLDVAAQVSASGLSARVSGKADVLDDAGLRGQFDVVLAAADAAPLWAQGSWGQRLPVSLQGRLAVSPGRIDIEEIAGSVQGSLVRGRLGIELGATPRVGGHIAADETVVPGLLAGIVGLPSPGIARDGLASPEPFEAGLFGKIVGAVEFEAGRAIFAPGFRTRSLSGRLRLDSDEIAFEGIEGNLGEGRIAGELAFRREAGSLSTRARIALGNVDTTALVSGPGPPGVSGRLTLQVEADGSGHSPATLIGSLKGAGTVSIEAARLAALNPQAFARAIEAADRGVTLTAAKISEIVAPVLVAGDLAIQRADGALSIAAGQARLSSVIAHGEGADLALSGALDLASRAMDARLTLSGPAEGGAPGTARPDLFITLQGPAHAPQRTVDVSALVNWLMLRSLDRETRRMEAVEAAKPDPAAAAPMDPSVSSRPAPETPGPPPEPQAAPARPETGNAVRPNQAAPPRPQTGNAVQPNTGAPVEQAPSLPPPVEIRPPPGASSNRAARPRESSPQPARPLAREGTASPARQNRWIDRLFGPHN
jgi:uncharacterized protein involved in outer membrane biogenesis